MPFRRKGTKEKRVERRSAAGQSRKLRRSAGPASAWTLATVPQIVVGLVQPVFARGIEDVEVHGIFQRPGLVWHARRDAQHFAGVNDDLLSIDRKFQRAFEDVSHLLVVVVMQLM